MFVYFRTFRCDIRMDISVDGEATTVNHLVSGLNGQSAIETGSGRRRPPAVSIRIGRERRFRTTHLNHSGEGQDGQAEESGHLEYVLLGEAVPFRGVVLEEQEHAGVVLEDYAAQTVEDFRRTVVLDGENVLILLQALFDRVVPLEVEVGVRHLPDQLAAQTAGDVPVQVGDVAPERYGDAQLGQPPAADRRCARPEPEAQHDQRGGEQYPVREPGHRRRTGAICF